MLSRRTGRMCGTPPYRWTWSGGHLAFDALFSLRTSFHHCAPSLTHVDLHPSPRFISAELGKFFTRFLFLAPILSMSCLYMPDLIMRWQPWSRPWPTKHTFTVNVPRLWILRTSPTPNSCLGLQLCVSRSCTTSSPRLSPFKNNATPCLLNFCFSSSRKADVVAKRSIAIHSKEVLFWARVFAVGVPEPSMPD